MENFFLVTKDGTTLNVELGPKLYTVNAPALTELEEKSELRRQTLDDYAAHNDVVCETMKLGQEE